MALAPPVKNLNIVVVGMTLIWILSQTWPCSLSVFLTLDADVYDQSVLRQCHLLQDRPCSGFVVWNYPSPDVQAVELSHCLPYRADWGSHLDLVCEYFIKIHFMLCIRNHCVLLQYLLPFIFLMYFTLLVCSVYPLIYCGKMALKKKKKATFFCLH